MAEEQLGRLALAGGERILDVGCGDGKINPPNAARVPRGSVLGVDPSRAMVAFAKSHYGPPDHANLTFAVADARRLSYAGEFDLVVSFNALHWVHEQEAALGSIRAALVPGGEALLKFVPAGPRQSLEDVIEEVRQTPRWAGCFADFQTPHAHFTADEYRALAERSGFAVRRLEVEDKAWDFGSRADFSAFARATFIAWTSRLAEDQREPFVDEVLDRYARLVAASESERHTFKFYQLEARLVRVG
jgi:trans-aconitate 2-methyltransferase